MPDAMSPDPEVVALAQDDIGCQYCWSDPRYTKIADDKARRCPVCGADYTGPRRPSLVPFTHAAGYRVVAAETEPREEFAERKCPACAAVVGPSETHWRQYGLDGSYFCPFVAAPTEEERQHE